MSLIQLFAIVMFLCYFFSKGIKKHATLIYIVAILLCVATYYANVNGLTRGLPTYFRSYWFGPLKNGIFPTILLVVVMFLGALEDKSKIRKRLMPIRAELSILACILTVAHVVLCWSHFLQVLPPRVYTASYTHTVCILTGIYACLIMIPLWVTSYTSVRKKMSRPAWVNLQNFAYLVYALIYIHAFALLIGKSGSGFFAAPAIPSFTPSTRVASELPFYFNGSFIKIMVYSVFFFSYPILRIEKYLSKQKEEAAA